MANWAVLLGYCFVFSILKNCSSQDTINPSQVLRDGGTLVSAGGIFELGFFSPADLSYRYLGLWYKDITPQTVVWVANREFPLHDTLGAVNFTNQGILVLVNSAKEVVWSSKLSRTAQDPVLQLLDSGNLIVRERGLNDDDQENYLWQSFDRFCDTLLPGMKIGMNFFTGFERYLSSWKSTEDPAPGQFSAHIDTHGYPQLVVRKGSRIQYRPGSWNGISWTGTTFLKSGLVLAAEFVLNEKEVYFEFKVPSGSDLTRYTIYSSGLVQRYTWNGRSREWVVIGTTEADECENYALCGAYGSCDINSSPVCGCLGGFIPKSPREWNSTDWSDGCVRRTPLDCGGKDGFLKHSGLKLPDTSSSSWFNRTISLEDCERWCLNNCSCTAYANLDFRGTGCLFWYGELMDIRTLTGGQDLYVRMALSELDSLERIRPSSKKKQTGIIVASIVVAVVILLVAAVLCLYRIKIWGDVAQKYTLKNENVGGMKEDMEMLIFDLTTVANATKNFSNSNKLGEGGFGPVYKGRLLEGQEIAVKRLSKSSCQGLNEFKNEVVLISKLQHRNLVRLQGCCFHEDEKMLIYEYMPNKSLDSFIFDKTRRKLLDWHNRIHIVEGIARGLLYLHQDSRLRIIHRDLKASNILLDYHMNPKISDFGLARIVGADQTEANTNRVVGTYGYMAPEYAMDGHFSTQSDVFSFGVLILEIVSGRRNQGFLHPDLEFNLLGHAWMLWTKGTPVELIDECLFHSFIPSEVTRCIHIALLCVQQRPWDRPSMSTVVLMLSSDNQLPEPKQPGFSIGRNPLGGSPMRNALYSKNDISITMLEAR